MLPVVLVRRLFLLLSYDGHIVKENSVSCGGVAAVAPPLLLIRMNVSNSEIAFIVT